MICVFLDLSSYYVLCLCRFVLSPVNAPSAGHTVSVDELESYLNRALSTTPHNLLLFLQDKVYRIYIYTFAQIYIYSFFISKNSFCKYINNPDFWLKKESYNIWSLNFVTAYIMHYVSVLPRVYKGQKNKNNSHKKDHNITHDRYRILNALTWETFNFNKDNSLKWLVLAIVKCKTQVTHEPSAATLALSTTGIRLVQTVPILSFEFPPCFIQLSVDDFTMYGGVFGNKQDSVFQNLEVCWCVFHLSLLLIFITTAYDFDFS